MNKVNIRYTTYNTVANKLTCMSNIQLKQLLSDGKTLHEGIGGTSHQISVKDTPVFVKKVAITDIELLPENYMSTSNIFDLPNCYQYGIGSAGFGVWRELASHIMTTNWVLTGECPNFPLMYHSRIIKNDDIKTISMEEQNKLNEDATYWENNEGINKRLSAKALSSHSIFLFLEFIPRHLYSWLNEKLSTNNDTAINAINFVHEQMQVANNFMRTQEFLHMDAHFENILTDGKQLYYADFGLAISKQFDLNTSEVQFMYNNRDYDNASGMTNLVHGVLTSYLGKHNWERCMTTALNLDTENNLPVEIIKLISKQYTVARKMHQFYMAIQKDKSTLFPADDIKTLLS